MNEKITKPGVVRRVTDKLQKGTRKHIAPEIVEKYLMAFLDTVVDVLAEGDSINLNEYMSISPQLHKEKRVQSIADKEMMIVPAHYKAKFRAGTKINKACEHLTEVENND